MTDNYSQTNNSPSQAQPPNQNPINPNPLSNPYPPAGSDPNQVNNLPNLANNQQQSEQTQQQNVQTPQMPVTQPNTSQTEDQNSGQNYNQNSHLQDLNYTTRPEAQQNPNPQIENTPQPMQSQPLQQDIQNPPDQNPNYAPPPQTLENPSMPSEFQAQQQTQQNSKKVLIVEDEVPLLKALSQKLSHDGFVVTEAVNGRDGLMKAEETKPDIIITDIVMPDMDGLNMIKTLRESEWAKETPVILLTNLNNSEDVATALLYNVSDYLVKADTKLKDIVDKVKEKLG
jgi:CheY-like chemotaxis protein